MRVITGSARGRRLESLEGLDTRPTGEKVKEAEFSSIQFEIEGRAVLDLFAGSGQLGIEALSRGAKSAIFVDSNPEAIKIIKSNLDKTDLAKSASAASGDYVQFLTYTKAVFDVVFIDPPYSKELAEKALPLVIPHMSAGGVILVETAKQDPMPEEVSGWHITKKADYGKTTVRIYRKIQDVLA